MGGNMAKEGWKPRVTITVDAAHLRRVDRLAKRLGLSRSGFLAEAIKSYLDEAEMQAKVMGDPIVLRAFSEAMTRPGVMSAIAEALGAQLTEKQTQTLMDFLSNANKAGGSE